MKALAILLIICFAGSAGASVRPAGIALEWYLEDQGASGTVRTKYTGGEYVIFEWVVPGLAQPTPLQLETIINDYEQSLVDKQAEKVASKGKTKIKLGLTDKQLEELKQALEITP